MEPLWPSSFDTPDLPSAKSIIEKQAALLPSLTNYKVQGDVSESSPLEMTGMLRSDFVFRFDLTSRFLQSYKFRVFSFGHDITLYPVNFMIDADISKELGLPSGVFGGKVEVSDPEGLTRLLQGVFQTKRLGSVIGSIMRLAS